MTRRGRSVLALLPAVAANIPGEAPSATVSCATFGQAYEDATAQAPALPNGAFLTDALQCQNSCASNPMCEHFTWRRLSTWLPSRRNIHRPHRALLCFVSAPFWFTDTHGCWLGKGSSLVMSPKAVSGPKHCLSTTATGATTAAPSAAATTALPVTGVTVPQVPSVPSAGSNSWLWWPLGAGAIILVSLVSCMLVGKKKPKESARKRHARRTQGMQEVEEDVEEPESVEKPLMPWEQRKLESRSNKMGFQAPGSFMRLPLTAQRPQPLSGPHLPPEMEATQQLVALPPTGRYIVS
ncbi:unnamed protein product [Durusdinium trenchii]|uniref:Apple domain-containing protein n=1 Tax=Durusdinium trenchii TaxID=1381693 RepID=A0ABP0QKF2_9DINO